jgi:ureidoacrylate peracid hydrolase
VGEEDPPSSDIDAQLRSRGIDTLLIAGTATNVCCESTARDAMMLDYRVIMLSDANATDEEGPGCTRDAARRRAAA